MNELITAQYGSTDKNFTMSSLDFLNNIINPARVAAGESPIENRKFLIKVEDELDDLPERKKIPHEKINNLKTPDQWSYDLTFDQMMLVGMRESKVVRKKVLAKLKELQKVQTAFPVPQTMGEALRLAADLWEEKERLKLILQQTVKYYDVLRVVKANPDFGLDAKKLWRPLNSWCVEANVEVKRVFCPRYGSVNAYPYEAWRAVYPALELPQEAATLLEDMECKDE